VTDRTEILLVDDEPALRELMKVALGDGYRFLEAGDVDAALALLRAHVPAVVLLDVMLPGGSGLDVLRAIRADPAVSSARVVIVSAWQSADDRQTALELGADAFLAKPFSVDELVSVVADLAGEVA
jgi:DNA-binding response OmpR family regulator